MLFSHNNKLTLLLFIDIIHFSIVVGLRFRTLAIGVMAVCLETKWSDLSAIVAPRLHLDKL